MRVLNYTRAVLTFLNYRTNCARRQGKFITGTAKMEPGGEWICRSCPADTLLISVLHYKHPIWHSRFPSILSLWMPFDGRSFVPLSFGLVYKQLLEQGGFKKNTHTPTHRLIWHFISPLMRHVSLLTHSEASLHKSWSLAFFSGCIRVSIFAPLISEGRLWCLI